VTPNLFFIFLKPALKQPGCPICRVRDEFELRYIENTIYENVNDSSTWINILASLGYCPKHTWQMGLMEKGEFGDALGNSIIYERLVKVVENHLSQYIHHNQSRHQSRFLQQLNRLLRCKRTHSQDPFEPLVHAKCRVCQMGDGTEESCIQWLLEGVSEPEPELREMYQQSGGLCLVHFRQVLCISNPKFESGVEFLTNTMLRDLSTLKNNLNQYAGKKSWDRRMEEMSPDEKVSWIKALSFFGGNVENLFLSPKMTVNFDDKDESQ